MMKSLVVLSGAGMSQESGLKTFRDMGGLWEQYDVTEVASPEAWAKNPKLVMRFYNERRQHLLAGIKPNAGHEALATLERAVKQRGGEFLLITQNIDNLHELAGSQNIRHMHGELLAMRCKVSEQVFEWLTDSDTDSICPCCQQAGNLRPHVVWFGEMPLYMDEIETALSQCDLFLSIGTSGHVYPAAGFYQAAKHFGGHTVELNLEVSQAGSQFDEQRYGPATQLLPSYVEELLA